MRSEISADAGWPGIASDFFMFASRQSAYIHLQDSAG